MGAETNAHVDADWKTGSKAMVIKSVPMDYMNTIVFAIRGTATFMDWAVNLNAAPTSPIGFLVSLTTIPHQGTPLTWIGRSWQLVPRGVPWCCP